MPEWTALLILPAMVLAALWWAQVKHERKETCI